MIEDLIINQKDMRVEYAITSGENICDEHNCYPKEKLLVYHIMLGVVKNWNENNKELPL